MKYAFLKAFFLSITLLSFTNPSFSQDSSHKSTKDSLYQKYIKNSAVNQQTTEPEKRNNSFTDALDEATDTKILHEIDLYNKAKFMKSPEYIICIMLIVFAFLVTCLEVFLFMRGKLASGQVGRLLIITLIIFSVLFLIAAGYSNDQIAPAIGLLGTIAGYLLGRTSPTNGNR